ncbi:MAG TPA: hypothetical protein PK622_13570 [Saprospiraceae bacterium]|jgi:nickel/cobalt exporter|nr:hypothetical protein [Saprospiraceae bacterium]HUN17846.1 hypothetical protein [Saprospiraceae bacterium]
MLKVIIFGTIMISVLHAIIPSHWLPILSISKSRKWTKRETLRVTFLAGLAHVCSTIVLGLFISYFGAQLKLFLEDFLKIALPISLILFGIYFLYRHHTHHHFHIDAQKLNEKNDNDYAIIFSIMGIMFFSPCLEIVPYFLMAGANGIPSVILLSIIFLAVSISGMLLWMFLVYEGTKKMNWHFIEHNAGLITGIILILTGVLSYYSGH